MRVDLYRCYEILGVPSTAGKDEVKKRLRILQKLYHPDRLGHDPSVATEGTKKLAEINSAYDALEKAGFPQLAPQPGSSAKRSEQASPPPSQPDRESHHQHRPHSEGHTTHYGAAASIVVLQIETRFIFVTKLPFTIGRSPD